MSVDSIRESKVVSPAGGVQRRWQIAVRRVPARTVAVIQRRGDAPGGLLVEALSGHGLRVNTIRADLGEPLPDPASMLLAVALGSDGGADEVARTWSDAQLDWLQEADRAGTSVLGIGSGAHALAVALGGGSEPAARPQHGWIKIASSVPRWITPGPWLAWREDTVSPPRGARVLAHGVLGPEVFTVHGHLGVQFHPEVTPAIVRDWVIRAGERVLDSQGILEATWREYVTAAAGARQLAAGFLRSLATSPV
jgi:GMP synthase-like glutamine amidotransferase